MKPKTLKMEPRWGPEARKWSKNCAKTIKKSKNNIGPTRKRRVPNCVAPFRRKKWPTWFQVGFPKRTKIERRKKAKIDKKSMGFRIDF